MCMHERWLQFQQNKLNWRLITYNFKKSNKVVENCFLLHWNFRASNLRYKKEKLLVYVRKGKKLINSAIKKTLSLFFLLFVKLLISVSFLSSLYPSINVYYELRRLGVANQMGLDFSIVWKTADSNLNTSIVVRLMADYNSNPDIDMVFQLTADYDLKVNYIIKDGPFSII